ncbi:MAG: MarR family transcriptional regulator [Alphaproteobacteria bacterium]|nr:MarR family transcriptional regulator [Rhodospirillales bacterium]MCW9045483.1 MarR family transcriptional regulator [Alphaproteobacteria bacterium]
MKDNNIENVLNTILVSDGYYLTFIADHFAGPVNSRIAKEFNLTKPETLIIFLLSQQDGLKAQDIVKLSGFRKNSISRGVKLLLKAELIMREANPNDGRSSFLYITPKGKEIVKTIIPWFAHSEAKTFSALSPTERETFHQLTKKIVQSLSP